MSNNTSTTADTQVVTDRGDYLRRQRDKYEREVENIQARIDLIEADAKHEVAMLKWDLSTAKKKVKALDEQIAGK